MFVFTSALYVGLNQTTFLFLFRKGFSWILPNFRFLLKPLLFRTFSYKGFALLNSSSLMDNNERRCSRLWVAASKYLVGDLSQHLHKAGYHWVFQCHSKTQSHCKLSVLTHSHCNTPSLREKCLNTELFLVRIFPHSD